MFPRRRPIDCIAGLTIDASQDEEEEELNEIDVIGV